MKFLLIVLNAALLVHVSTFAQLQKTDTCGDYFNRLYQSVQEAYGIDQVLVNGIFYEDIYPNKVGHPFLYENEFYKGTITFRGKEYTGIDLKYDLLEQKLVLYVNYNNSFTWVILPNDFISDFTLNGKFFAKFSYRGEPKFYQVIFDSDNLKCLYHYSKSKFDADHSGKFNKVEFKENPRKNYLVLEGKFKKYNNNRSFTKSFPIETRSAIQSYLGSNKIKVAKNNNDTIMSLLAFCNSLLKH
jgi:hypothetical protein